MDFESFVKAHSNDSMKRMIHSKKKLFKANQPFHQKSVFRRTWAWSSKKISCQKWLQRDISSVWNMWPCCAFTNCRAVSGAGGWLCLAKSIWSSLKHWPDSRKKLQTGALHSPTFMTSSKVALIAEGWQGNGKLSEFGDKKVMISSHGCVLSLSPVWSF